MNGRRLLRQTLGRPFGSNNNFAHRHDPSPATRVVSPVGCRMTGIEGGMMNKDRIEGAAKQAKGAVKEAVGKATNSPKTQMSGKADKVEGKVQNTYGKAKDALKH
jgi:uncharacterized protein YjbJ (UPF0337 family)